MRKRKFENKGAIGLVALVVIGLIFGLVGIWAYYKLGGLVGLAFQIFQVLVNALIPAINWLFNQLGKVAANLINVFVVLNPFSVGTFAPIIWEICKNIAYLVLIFLGLIAGFMYILGKDENARRILMYCIISAFLINFTFLLSKEVFYVSWVLVKAFAGYFSPEGCKEIKGYTFCDVGTAIYTSLSITIANRNLADALRNAAIKALSAEVTGEEGKIGNVQAMVLLGVGLATIILNLVAFIILMGFAFIALGRFLIISFLVGVLPLVLVLYAIPQYSKYWERWWHEFLKWCFNLPILMILILIGFALIAYGTGYFSEAKEEGLFLALVENSTIWGVGNIKDYAEALALILRFVFITAYYVLIMVLCQNLGGTFGKFGVNAGKWIWMKIGGAAVWGARTAWKPAAEKIGEKFESAAERFSRLASKPVVGGMFGGLKRLAESVGGKMRKPTKEKRGEEAENIYEAYEKRGERGKLLQEVLEGKHKRLEVELTKILTDRLSKEEIIDVLAKMDEGRLKTVFDKNKKIFSMLNKRLEGLLTATTPDEIATTILTFDAIKTNFIGLEKAMAAQGKDFLQGFQTAFNLASNEMKRKWGFNQTTWSAGWRIKLYTDPAYQRGVRANPDYNAYNTATTPQAKDQIVEAIAKRLNPSQPQAIEADIENLFKNV